MLYKAETISLRYKGCVHFTCKSSRLFSPFFFLSFNLPFNLAYVFLCYFFQVRFGEPQHAESEEIFTAISEFVKSFKREADITLMAAGQTHLVRYVTNKKKMKKGKQKRPFFIPSKH